MKKIVYFAVAVCSVTSGVAQAQNSVSLYGILDERISFDTNMSGSRSYAMQSDVLQGNRWGLRGTEDLGGGLKSVFQLENGFNVSTGKLGQGGLMFGRQAFVGLSNSYGTITLGRQYDVATEFVEPFAVGTQWAGTIGAHPGDLDNLNNSFRTNNAVKFKRVSYGGLSFGGMYSFGGVAGDATRNQVSSVAAAYTDGPLAAAVVI